MKPKIETALSEAAENKAKTLAALDALKVVSEALKSLPMADQERVCRASLVLLGHPKEIILP